jgi:predicted Fe-S protein YdhL (DUF1289 family)
MRRRQRRRIHGSNAAAFLMKILAVPCVCSVAGLVLARDDGSSFIDCTTFAMTSETAPFSPCTGVCRLDGAKICLGCYRHVEEIRQWGLLAPEQQRKILALVAQRRRLSHPDLDSSHD